jgi:hypothetical protein
MFCDVEVDPETGHVKVLRYTAAQDSGRAIHPSYVQGQIQGGVTQGIGRALSEEYIYDKRGRMDNPGFLDYRCPVASDMPMIDAVIVEVPNPPHPFGVRGVGEVPIVPPMAAVANAIADTIGRRSGARSALRSGHSPRDRHWTVNALADCCWLHRPHPEVELRNGPDAFDATDIRSRDQVVVVGAFVPFLKELKRRRQSFLVLEQDAATLKADELPFFRPAERAAEVLPTADAC